MKWKTLEKKIIFKSGFFEVRKEKCQLANGKIHPSYFVMEFADWVNVIPITEEGQFVLLKQYRHASSEVHIEVPGGTMEPGTNETSKEAAARELLEETGLQSQNMQLIGSHYPNPALQTNRVHTFLARGCKKVADPCLDPFEELQEYHCDQEEVERLLYDGTINHTIMIASLFMALRVL